MTAANGWSTPATIEQALRRRWDSGELLRSHGRGERFVEVEVPLRGPTAGDAAGSRAELLRWRTELERGAAHRGHPIYHLVTRSIGGRVAGRHEIPARAVVRDFDEAWRLLGVGEQVATFDNVLATTRERAPGLVEWVLRHPLRALGLADVWAELVSAVGWLATRSGRGQYLREIDLPGLDTKFVESHRGALAELLDTLAPPLDSRRSRGREFAQRYGFLAPEPLVRIRPGPGTLPMFPGLTELGLRREELASLPVAPRRVLVIENEVTYLAVPVEPGAAVVFGNGWTVAGLGRIGWLADCDVWYWGDLDTHGFAILNGLRASVPHARSLLMDRRTLLAHEERWVMEPAPTRAGLDRLTPAESDLYVDLVEDVLGPAVRLEQERIAWPHVLAAVGDLPSVPHPPCG